MGKFRYFSTNPACSIVNFTKTQKHNQTYPLAKSCQTYGNIIYGLASIHIFSSDATLVNFTLLFDPFSVTLFTFVRQNIMKLTSQRQTKVLWWWNRHKWSKQKHHPDCPRTPCESTTTPENISCVWERLDVPRGLWYILRYNIWDTQSKSTRNSSIIFTSLSSR